RALETVFDRVTDELRANDDRFETRPTGVGKMDCWPRLEIEHPEWRKVFGKGELNRLWLWFTVAGIWEATNSCFFPELQLWGMDFGADWQTTRDKLSVWKQKLEKGNTPLTFWIHPSRVEPEKKLAKGPLTPTP